MNKKIITSIIVLMILGVTGVVFWGRMKGNNEEDFLDSETATREASQIYNGIPIKSPVVADNNNTNSLSPEQVLAKVAEDLKSHNVESAKMRSYQVEKEI